MIDLPQGLLVAIEVISYCIIALLGIAIAIRAASLYARYKAAKKVTVDVDDSKVLKVEQEEGSAIILCKEVDGVSEDVAQGTQPVAPSGAPVVVPGAGSNTEEDK